MHDEATMLMMRGQRPRGTPSTMDRGDPRTNRLSATRPAGLDQGRANLITQLSSMSNGRHKLSREIGRYAPQRDWRPQVSAIA